MKTIKPLLKITAGTFLLLCLGVIYYFYQNKMSPVQSIQLIPDLVSRAVEFWQFWVVLLLPGFVWLWFKWLMDSRWQYGQKAMLWRLLGSMLVVFFMGVGWHFYTNINDTKEDWRKIVEDRNYRVFNHFQKDKKIRGVHFQPARVAADSQFYHLIKNNVEWIEVNSFAYPSMDSLGLIELPPLNEFGYSRRDSQITQLAANAQKFGIRTALAPLLQIEEATKNNLIDTLSADTALFKKWFATYTQWIIQQSKIAEQQELPLFFIGIDLDPLSTTYPNYFHQLSDTIRTFYSGKITYAANWKTDYRAIDFWNKLDYITIQSGFHLTDEKSPQVAHLQEKWQPIKDTLQQLYKQLDKPILLHKIAYATLDNAANDPYDMEGSFFERMERYDQRTQRNCYEAIFQIFWKEDWIKGYFFYNWEANYDRAGGENDTGFSMQRKKAEQVMGDWYSKY